MFQHCLPDDEAGGDWLVGVGTGILPESLKQIFHLFIKKKYTLSTYPVPNTSQYYGYSGKSMQTNKQKIHRSLCLKAHNMYNDGKCCAEENKAEVGPGSSQ